jgi:hypothetical protein
MKRVLEWRAGEKLCHETRAVFHSLKKTSPTENSKCKARGNIKKAFIELSETKFDEKKLKHK